ncbi:MAG: VOC family protein [Phycisphaerales bacterium]
MPSTIIPGMRYRDAHAAIDWLERVFGFRRHLVVPGENNTIVHAQLAYGEGMVMLSSITDSPASSIMAQPDEVGGRETQSPYILVSDADAVYARAKAAGAKIVIEIKSPEYGGRAFSCADPEGHVWHVGTYDPWAEQG